MRAFQIAYRVGYTAFGLSCLAFAGWAAWLEYPSGGVIGAIEGAVRGAFVPWLALLILAGLPLTAWFLLVQLARAVLWLNDHCVEPAVRWIEWAVKGA